MGEHVKGFLGSYIAVSAVLRSKRKWGRVVAYVSRLSKIVEGDTWVTNGRFELRKVPRIRELRYVSRVA
jgi:hypothetical protein